MKIQSFTSLAPKDFCNGSKYDLALIGEALDERGQEACKFASEHALETIKYVFDPGRREHSFNGKSITLAALSLLLAKNKKILLEATTLGVSEIALLMRSLKTSNIPGFDVLYVEPQLYKQAVTKRLFSNREFSLTDEQRSLGVPGFTIDFQQHTKGTFVVFLGYEGQRLTTALNQLPLEEHWVKIAVFGVPGFGAGWEINSFANNIDQIHQSDFQAIRYCAASSVSDSFQLLQRIQSTHQDKEAPIVIAPFGTKPHSIATALFLCEHSQFDETALVFDHPKKAPGRSSKVWRWHRYEIKNYCSS